MANTGQQTSWMTTFVAIMALPLALHALYATGQKAVESYHLSRQADAIRAEIEQLRGENVRLQREIEADRTDVRLEQMAREELGLAMPGDRVLIVTEPGGAPTRAEPRAARQAIAETRPSELPAWKQWWRFFFGPLGE